MKKLIARCIVIILNSLLVAHSVFPYVGADGSFTYSIPIELPPAPGNHRPDLGLTYNSNASGEYLGRGWILTGLPVIRRMDYGNGINFDGNDTYTGPEGRRSC